MLFSFCTHFKSFSSTISSELFNSRFVVDEDDNGKSRLERVIIKLISNSVPEWRIQKRQGALGWGFKPSAYFVRRAGALG